MKKQAYLVLASLSLTAVFVVTAQAQSSSNRQQLRVQIPFAFSIGSKVLPAGDYSVRIVNPSSDRAVLEIASLDGTSTAIAQTNDIVGWAPSHPKLSFRQYGDQYFLAQVWMAGESTGIATRESSMEKSLRRQLSKNARKADLIAVNAH